MTRLIVAAQIKSKKTRQKALESRRERSSYARDLVLGADQDARWSRVATGHGDKEICRGGHLLAALSHNVIQTQIQLIKRQRFGDVGCSFAHRILVHRRVIYFKATAERETEERLANEVRGSYAN